MDLRVAYEHHAAEWDAEFRRVHERFAGQMQCRRGCSMCCSQMFSISAIEAAAIAEAVAVLPEPDRERLRTAARAYLDRATELNVVTDSSGEASISPRTGVRLPCPALHDDACALYAARPIICRKWGIPVFNPSNPDRLHACELNFRAGETIDAGDLVAHQTALLQRWVAVKESARERMRPQHRTFTVAEAILADPSAFRREEPHS